METTYGQKYDTAAQRHRDASTMRRANVALCEADLKNHVKLPHHLRCKPCVFAHGPCYVKKIYTRPNGDSTRSCACCQKNCDFVTMGINNQSILQRWLDGDRSNGITTKSTSSSTISTPVTTRGSGFSLPNTLDSSTTSSIRSWPSSDDTPTVSDVNRPESIQPSPDHHIDASINTNEGSQKSNPTIPHFDASQTNNGHTKRSRDDTETTETSSEKSPKSTRIDTTTPLANITSLASQEAGCGPAHYILGLSAWLETVSEKEKASEVAMEDILQRCERQRVTITSMQDEKKSLEGKIYELQDQRDDTIGVVETAQAKVRELEAECIQLKSDRQVYKEEMDTLRGQSKEGVEKGRQAADAVIRLEDGRDADRLVIADLKSQVGETTELRRQHEAAIKNADKSRKQRNECQDTLTTAQAENAQLTEQLTTITTEYETATIELDEYRTGFKKSQAVSAELINTKADLTILQRDYQQLLADNARLLRETGCMEEVKEKSKINQQLADDRLEERQEMEIELCQVRSEGRESESRAKKADGKAEEIRKNWNIAKNELLAVHKSNRKLKVELKKHANCSGGEIVKRE